MNTDQVKGTLKDVAGRIHEEHIDKSPRLLRRSNTLRGLSHEEVKQVLVRSP